MDGGFSVLASDGVNAVLTFTLYLLAAVMLAITLYATESRL